MHRMDPVLMELDQELAGSPSESDSERLRAEIKQREKLLAPLYLQVAHEFADLHDRAGRMKAKGCISEILEWKSSRKFFYWRIRRRLLEDSLKNQLMDASNGLISNSDASSKISQVLPAGDDKTIVQWMLNNAEITSNLVKQVRFDHASKNVLNALAGLSPEETKIILSSLNNNSK